MKNVLSYIVLLSVVAGMMVSCSKSNDVGPEDTGALEASITFTESPDNKAVSSYRPATSWSNSIKSLYIMLYDGSNVVKYGKEITPSEITAALSGSTASFLWSDVPTGTYTVVAVANAKQGVNDFYGISMLSSLTGASYNTATINGLPMNTTSVAGTAWSDYGVRSKSVASQLLLYLKDGNAFPAEVVTATAGEADAANYSYHTPKVGPSEIFTAYGTTTISSGGSSSLALQLKREVSLMRLRLDVTSGGKDLTPSNPDHAAVASNLANVDFTGSNGMLWYHGIPDGAVTVQNGTAGWLQGLGNGFNQYWSVMVADGTTDAFRDNNPAGGDVIGLTDQCTLWRDIIVFPNESQRGAVSASANLDGTLAQTNQWYTVVIGGRVKDGCTYTDDAGNTVAAGKMVYWSALVKGLFAANSIREINLVIVKNGTTTPPGPREEGSLSIELTSPLPWDSNIVSESHQI